MLFNNDKQHSVKKEATNFFTIESGFFDKMYFKKVITKAKKQGISKAEVISTIFYVIDLINKNKGYYVNVDEDFFDEINEELEIEKSKEIIEIMVELKWFDKDIYNKNILTSKTFQEKYISSKNRNKVNIPDDICLIGEVSIKKNNETGVDFLDD